MKSVFLLFAVMFSGVFYAQTGNIDLGAVESAFIDANYSLVVEESKKIINTEGADSTVLSMANAYAGLACEESGDLPDAINYYKKAIALRVPRLDIYQKLAITAKQQEDSESYEYALLQQCEVYPDFCVEVKSKLVSHYLKTKQYNQLSETTSELLLLYPDEVKFVYYKALAMKSLDSLTLAKEYYRKTLALDPDHLGANMSLGTLLYKEGTVIFKEEKKAYESLKNPDRMDYHDYIKASEKGKAIYREASVYLLKANEIKPNKNLNPVLFNLYSRLGESDKAAQYK